MEGPGSRNVEGSGFRGLGLRGFGFWGLCLLVLLGEEMGVGVWGLGSRFLGLGLRFNLRVSSSGIGSCGWQTRVCCRLTFACNAQSLENHNARVCPETLLYS